MKVALIADTHANLPALEAVLADAEERAAEALWNLGDFVGYGPHPNEVIDRLRSEGAVSIIGNYDRKVLAFPRQEEKWRRKKTPEKFLAFRWAYETLTESNRAYLRSLPEQARCEAAGQRVLLTHGSPAEIDEAVSPETPRKRLDELVRLADADVIACGHTHRAFHLCAGEVWFVNPGSVGRPEGDDPRASYAVLDFDEGGVQVHPRRVDYDVEAVAEAIRSLGLPDDFARMVRSGRNLDQVRAAEGDDPPPPPPARQEDAACIRAALALARRCRYEREHTHQVTRLALALFDELGPLHELGAEERLWLHCGALLHDIGWLEGRKGHHKTAMRIILEAPHLPLDRPGRLIVALVARYHRKAVPDEGHAHVGALAAEDRRRMEMLAAILRVADGLDRSHTSLVRRVRCEIGPRRVLIRCEAAGPAQPEQWAAVKKADLFERVFRRKVAVEMDSAVESAREAPPW